MKEYRNDSAKKTTISYGFLGAVLALVGLAMSGCSFKVETGWHGRTGRDDRVQTRLANDYGPEDGDERMVPASSRRKY
jgi:hypothetical protein